MRDLIERLRESAQNNDCEGCGDAADELATLKARLAEAERVVRAHAADLRASVNTLAA